MVYGEYTETGPEWDFDVDDSMANWAREKRLTDERVASYATLGAAGAGNGCSLRWSLQKLVGEYARHNGHVDLVRERIDGATGE